MIVIEKKRLNSVKTRIKQVTGGRYMPQDGFNPNCVLTQHGLRLSRVRIAATVVDKYLAESGKFASITIDDGTDTIRVKAFNAVSVFDNVDLGSELDIIAKIKEYQGEIYLVPEIITVLQDDNFILLRELELRAQEKGMEQKVGIVREHQKQASDVTELQRIMKERFGIQPEEVEAILQTQEEPGLHDAQSASSKDDKNKDDVLKLIEKHDEGNGCDYAELITLSGLPEDVVENVVNELLSDGVCFEPRPGKIKKL